MITDFNLVCQDSWKNPLSESIFFGGVLAGAIVNGQLGDYIGRKKVFLLTLLQTLGFGLVSVFSPSFTFYVVMQFFTAMGQVGVFQCAYVLGIELVGRRKRVFCAIIIQCFFVLGEIALAFFAWGLRNWVKLTIAYLLPCAVFLSYYFILPCSIRWCIANRKFGQAELELNKVAKWNGFPPLTDEDFKQYSKSGQQEERESFLALVRRPRMLGRLLVIFFSWAVTTMVYYGLSMNAASLAGNVFINFLLLALFEFPGNLLSYIGMQYYGRKTTLIASSMVSGCACLIYEVLPSTSVSAQTIFFLIGKFGVSSAFTTVYLYTSELFPTSVRNLCLGLSSMVGRIGAILSPYIIALGVSSGLPWIPMVVFGAAGITSGLTLLFLNETKGLPLPRTLDEAERMRPVPTIDREEEEEQQDLLHN